MKNKEYLFNGHVYRIAEEDLSHYPGAVPIEKSKEKAEPKAKANKAQLKGPVNKSKEG